MLYRRQKTRTLHRRDASITLELIIALPVLLIALLAVVEFGYFFTRMQQVALACRVGAEEASQTAGLPNSGTVPTSITDLINKQLDSSGISPCAVILEHNVNEFPAMSGLFPEMTLRTDFPPPCPGCTEPASAIPTRSVRVTVCVPLTQVMPNLLATFGFDISMKFASCSTTLAYEL